MKDWTNMPKNAIRMGGWSRHTALVAGTSTLDIRSAGRMSMLQLTLDDNKKTRSSNHLEICCMGLLFS